MIVGYGSYLENIVGIVPELVLVCAILASLVAGMFVKETVVRGMAVGFCGVAAVVSFFELNFYGKYGPLLGGFLIRTDYIYLARALVIGAAFAVSLMYFFVQRSYRYEFSVMMLLASLGAVTVVEANNFLSFYLSFELVGFSSYIMTCFNRSSTASSEAAVKFFILGAMSSCIMLYGISFIYGYSTSLSFSALEDVLLGRGTIGVTFGCTLCLIGVLFKLAAVPFHTWVPDTYRGAPTATVAFFTLVSKTAITLLCARFAAELPTISEGFQKIMLILAALSVTVGELGALQQRNAKKLVAYANIGHLGYVLAGIGAGSVAAAPVLYYVIVYFFINACVFSILLKYDDDGFDMLKIAGMGRKNPVSACILVVTMLALAGLPPFPGFFAKYSILRAIVAGVTDAFSIHALISILSLSITSIIPCFYCFRIAKVIYFDESSEDYADISGRGLCIITCACILLGVSMIPLMNSFMSYFGHFPR